MQPIDYFYYYAKQLPLIFFKVLFPLHKLYTNGQIFLEEERKVSHNFCLSIFVTSVYSFFHLIKFSAFDENLNKLDCLDDWKKVA
jgi:hypothetical protein